MSPRPPADRERRQHRLDPVAQVLESGRQDERLAEVLGVLVDREPGPERRDLEEDAARLAEVDGAEPEAVDDPARMGSGGAHGCEPCLLFVDVRGPGDVMHRPGAGNPLPGGRRRIVRVEAAADRAARLPGRLADGREPECSLEQRPARIRLGREGAHAVEALQRELGGDLRVAGDERRVRCLDDGELEPEPLRVLEPEPVALAPRRDPHVREARGPEVERLLRGDPEGDRVHHPGAGTAAAGARILEERDVGAGAALLVGVEEVIDGRVVLVDSLLDESQSEHAGVEVDVAGCVAGDAGHVMNAFEAHRYLLVVASSRRRV